ncbi:MAG: ABC transporter ATP-binding protein [Phycisphaerales bacterium]|nr:ABC transporter ATP-binding protein [Phycisphaerales bacterium]
MLKLINLRKSYGTVHAVDGLSLNIPRGSIFGFLGPNGAGKTTTINLCVGLLRPTSGAIDLDGVGSPEDPAVRMRIGVAPQSIALYDTLTAAENLNVFGKLYGLAHAVIRERSGELLDRVGLAERADDRVSTYSGGMKRRLNLAAALIHDPPLVMLDEPTAGVDPQSRNAILDTVRGLRDRGKTIVYTTHYMEEAQRLCDHVAIIDRGRLLAMDTVDNLIRAHGGTSVVTIQSSTGETRIQTAEPVGELVRRLKTEDVQNVRVDRPDLESVFLNLTGRSLRD